MRKQDIDALALRRPFDPFEIRLVDGQRFRFTSPEQLLVGRTTVVTMDREGTPVIINLQMIATLRRLNGHRTPKS